jgi:DnaJ family protein C protein 19
MGRLIVLLALAAVGCKLLLGRWPWEMMALPKPPADRAKARALLGVAPLATRSDIIEAHKRLLVQVHPDRGGNEALVHEANDARDLLLAELPTPAKP